MGVQRKGKAIMTAEVRARLWAEYTSGCFCPRPVLPKGPVIPYRPRFQFQRAAKAYADKIGMITFHASPTHKSAQGEVAHGCAHRATQWVRIDWSLER
jgi:hypothetical protein